jgi:geranylgeranyl diphosphate synthase type II
MVIEDTQPSRSATGKLETVPPDSRLKAYQALAEGRLDALLPSVAESPQRLHEAMRYSALAPGKRLRPALCMAAAEAVGGTARDALDAGCAAELVHCFSLIHDDLPAIDDDDLRRGRPTCHKVFGEAMAILAGDALFALAFQVVSEIEARDDRARTVTSMLARATGSAGLVGGEVIDIEGEGQEPNLDSLLAIHQRKTGSLITACCTMGALLGGGSEEELSAVAQYGENVGVAFQIADDVLNVTGTPEAIGKAVGSDIARGKQTYPGLLGLERATSEARQKTDAALASIGALDGDTRGLVELAMFSIERET